VRTNRTFRLPRVALTVAAAALLLSGARGFSADPPTTAPKGTAHIAGTVRGTDGKPAGGVTIKLVSKTAAPTAAVPTADKPKADKAKKKKADAGWNTTSEADGSFKFDDLPAGQYQITATLKGVGRKVQNLVLADGQTIPLTMQLTKGGK
jgi:hypothetical protein